VFCSRCDGSQDGDHCAPEIRSVIELSRRFASDPERYVDEVYDRGLERLAVYFLWGKEPAVVFDGQEVTGDALATETTAAQWELVSAVLADLKGDGKRGWDDFRADACALVGRVAPTRKEAEQALTALLSDSSVPVRASALVALANVNPDLDLRPIGSASLFLAINPDTGRRWYSPYDDARVVTTITRIRCAVPWADVGTLVALFESVVWDHQPELEAFAANGPVSAAVLHALDQVTGTHWGERLHPAVAALLDRVRTGLYTGPANDGERLLLNVWVHPKDETLRLVYADWLDEHEQPDRAASLRLVSDLGCSPEAVTVLSLWFSQSPDVGGHLRDDLLTHLATSDAPGWGERFRATERITDQHWLRLLQRICESSRV
jgi:uncharacterized protein (TIGR02996 family)